MKINLDQLKTAVKEYNAREGRACIMWDSSDGGVWTDILTGNDTKQYHSNTIYPLVIKGDLEGRNNKRNAQRLYKSLDEVIKQYDIDHPAAIITELINSVYYSPAMAAQKTRANG